MRHSAVLSATTARIKDKPSLQFIAIMCKLLANHKKCWAFLRRIRKISRKDEELQTYHNPSHSTHNKLTKSVPKFSLAAKS